MNPQKRRRDSFIIAFSARNPDGDIYIILMNRDGSLVTDPAKVGEVNKTGMVTVETDGAWYIVELSDPETLLNPFELAAQ